MSQQPFDRCGRSLFMRQMPPNQAHIEGVNKRFQATRADRVFILSYYQNYCSNYSQILFNDKDLQVLFA